jgi:hypothetical protein
MAARINKILARFLAASLPGSLENTHDPSGQSIPGFSSKYLLLWPKYNKWIRPCSPMNMPNMNLIEDFLLSVENGLERGSTFKIDLFSNGCLSFEYLLMIWFEMNTGWNSHAPGLPFRGMVPPAAS